jgi:hypothetical protein
MTIDRFVEMLNEKGIETDVSQSVLCRYSDFYLNGLPFWAENFCEYVRIQLNASLNGNAAVFAKRAFRRAMRKQHLVISEGLGVWVKIYNEKDVRRFLAAADELGGKKTYAKFANNNK